MTAAMGLVVLVLLSVVGEWVARAARLPVPGSVLGMLLLAALVHRDILPARLVDDAASLLIRHLALFYVPAGVAILVHAGAVQRDLVAIVAAGIASLLAVLVVTGVLVQRLGRAP